MGTNEQQELLQSSALTQPGLPFTESDAVNAVNRAHEIRGNEHLQAAKIASEEVIQKAKIDVQLKEIESKERIETSKIALQKSKVALEKEQLDFEREKYYNGQTPPPARGRSGMAGGRSASGGRGGGRGGRGRGGCSTPAVEQTNQQLAEKKEREAAQRKDRAERKKSVEGLGGGKEAKEANEAETLRPPVREIFEVYDKVMVTFPSDKQLPTRLAHLKGTTCAAVVLTVGEVSPYRMDVKITGEADKHSVYQKWATAAKATTAPSPSSLLLPLHIRLPPAHPLLCFLSQDVPNSAFDNVSILDGTEVHEFSTAAEELRDEIFAKSEVNVAERRTVEIGEQALEQALVSIKMPCSLITRCMNVSGVWPFVIDGRVYEKDLFVVDLNVLPEARLEELNEMAKVLTQWVTLDPEKKRKRDS